MREMHESGSTGGGDSSQGRLFMSTQKNGMSGRPRGRGSGAVVFRDAWGASVGACVDRVRRVIVYSKTDLVDGPQYLKYYPEYHALSRKIRGFNTRPGVNPSNASFSAKIKSEGVLDGWRERLMKVENDDSVASVAFTSTTQHSTTHLLFSLIQYWTSLHAPSMQSRPNTPYPPLNLLVLGMPNTGKSSLINALRVAGLGMGKQGRTGTKRGEKVVDVGKEPGVTRGVGEKIKILDTETVSRVSLGAETDVARMLVERGIRLRVYISDTPGILPPHFGPTITSTSTTPGTARDASDQERALKLGLVGCIPSDPHREGRGVDIHTLASYLWKRMCTHWNNAPLLLHILHQQNYIPSTMIIPKKNRNGNHGMRVEEVAHAISKSRGSVLRSGEVDVEAGLGWLVRQWRDGTMYRNMGLFPRKSYERKIKGSLDTRKVKHADIVRWSLLDDDQDQIG